MGENSTIEWCDHTFNPWIGCQKVSPGCDHCYAEAMMADRYRRVDWGPHGSRSRTSPGNWRKPLAWNRQAAAEGRRYRVFCASLADVFDNHRSITSGWHGDLWHLIAATPHLDWLLLTKRPQNVAKMLPESYGAPAWGDGWPNVWLGATVENQAEADRRIPHLLAVPAAVRFLSAEPLLSGIVLPLDFLTLGRRAWVITGGESGPKARPSRPEWFRDIRDQCAAAGVAYLHKQNGEWGPDPGPLPGGRDPIMEAKARCAWWDGTIWHIEPSGYAADPDRSVGAWVYRLGKSRAGRLLDGVEHNGFPGGAG